MKKGIIVFGASGAGTTSIGKALAKHLNYTHFDIDHYFWEETPIPFTVAREKQTRIKLLLNDLQREDNFIMSGSICGWDEPFLPLLHLAIFVETPTELRIERIKKREAERFGARIKMGGDMYEEHMDFIEWAKNYDIAGTDQRSKALHEQWMQNLSCKVVRLNGDITIADNVAFIMKYIRS